MQSSADIDAFVRDGFTLVPGVVPPALLRPALKAINASIGRGFATNQAVEMASKTWAPELVKDPRITGLLEPCHPLLDQLIGVGRWDIPDRAQIALRFPQDDEEVALSVPHLDGRPLGTNGVDSYRNFTLLVGVFLKDVPEANAGNLMVWPGTHETYAGYIRAHGVEGMQRGDMPEGELPQPISVVAQAGDVVLAHYQAGHAVAPHVGSDVRYAVYFRIKHVDHDKRQLECLTDIWLDYEALRAR